MTTQLLTKRAADLADFSRVKAEGQSLPFVPQDLAHVYIKLDFKKEHENARTAEDARGFLSSVSRASLAAHLLAERYGGMVLEVQGPMIHAALPNDPARVQAKLVNDLDFALEHRSDRPRRAARPRSRRRPLS